MQQVDIERRSPGVNRRSFRVLDRPHREVPQDANDLFPLPDEMLTLIPFFSSLIFNNFRELLFS